MMYDVRPYISESTCPYNRDLCIVRKEEDIEGEKRLRAAYTMYEIDEPELRVEMDSQAQGLHFSGIFSDLGPPLVKIKV